MKEAVQLKFCCKQLHCPMTLARCALFYSSSFAIFALEG